MKNNENIKGWISSLKNNGEFIGWLIDTNDISPRVAVIKINKTYTKEIICNQKRMKPKSYKEYTMNGFRLPLSLDIIKSLKDNQSNTISLIDKKTNSLISSCSFIVDTKLLKNMKSDNKNIEKDDQTVKTNSSFDIPISNTKENKNNQSQTPSSVLSDSKKQISTKNNAVYKGKLNSKFLNFKVTGWMADFNSKDVTESEVIIKLDDKFVFNSVANQERSDLLKKNINGGIGGFSIDIPIEVISQLPKIFKAELYAKNSNKLIDSVEYKNIELFTPKNVHEFLCYSMVNPVIYAPFNESHKRCFAFMENVASMLEKEIGEDNEPLVSVIMPVFNRQDVVLEAINSVLTQSYKNIELVIIDDCSTDNSVKVIKSVNDSRITLLQNKENKGCSYSRNYGVQHSHGDYIFYLDSDNTWDPRYIKVMMGAFKHIFDSQALYCGQYLFKGNNEKCYAVRYASFNRSLLENRNYIDLNCFCHTRKAFDAVGGFDNNLQRLVDYDLILRMSDNFDIYSVPVLLSNYYLGKCENAITSVKPLISLQRNTEFEAEKTTNANHKLKTSDNLYVSAIIPNYETIDDLEECIQSLVNCGCSEIIVVDNNSSKSTIDRLEELHNKKVIRLVKNKKNYGFTYAVNQGIELASKQNDIMLVNNDSVFTRKSVYEMKKAAYTLDKAGLVVPRQILYAGNGSINAHVPYANSGADCDVNLSIHHFNIEQVPLFSNGKNIELSFAPFFCVYIRRDVLNKAGLLDAQHGRHYRSDRIYCDVIRHILGLKIYYVASSIVYHKLQKSTSAMKKTKADSYDLIFIQNQWQDDERKEHGFKMKNWELA